MLSINVIFTAYYLGYPRCIIVIQDLAQLNIFKIKPVRVVNNFLVLCCMLCDVMQPPLPLVVLAARLSGVVVYTYIVPVFVRQKPLY